jgi:hypothetical protein
MLATTTFDMLVDTLVTLIFLAGTGGAALYYGAVITGLFKGPMLANFRCYGPERPMHPVIRFLLAAGAFCVVVAVLLRGGTTVARYGTGFASTIFWIGALVSWVAAGVIATQPALRDALPRWYLHLLKTATRQERRFIGFAWLRLPRRMRWRLNGDQRAFATWADMVRITVIYGAYDPDNPWKRWT